jgi:hypothetical protein
LLPVCESCQDCDVACLRKCIQPVHFTAARLFAREDTFRSPWPNPSAAEPSSTSLRPESGSVHNETASQSLFRDAD